jgi:hypothetical protein
MARSLTLTPGFRAGFRRIGVTSGTPLGRALGTTLAALSTADLPGPLDFEALIPPTRRAWVRRVPGRNLWVFYTFAAAEVRAVGLVDSPPVPLFDD